MAWIYYAPNWLVCAFCCAATLLFSLAGLFLLRPWVRAHVGDTAEHNVAYRLRLRGNQTNLAALLWRVLMLGAAINVAISWFFVAKDITHQVALTCLTALLLGSLLFLTAAMDNLFRGSFSVNASAFESMLYEMVTY